MTYPDGRVVYYNYSDSATDGTLGRLANISMTENATGALAAYTYLGELNESWVDEFPDT